MANCLASEIHPLLFNQHINAAQTPCVIPFTLYRVISFIVNIKTFISLKYLKTLKKMFGLII